MTEFQAPPVSAPLYSFEPGQKLLFPSAQIAMVMYGTERDRISHLVPAPCEVPRTPKLICFVARYEKSPVGPYLEAATLVESTFELGPGKIVREI